MMLLDRHRSRLYKIVYEVLIALAFGAVVEEKRLRL